MLSQTSAFLFEIVSWCNAVVFFESLIEIAVVAIAEHGRYFFDGEGRMLHKKHGSFHSFFQQYFCEFSPGLSM